MTDYICNDKSWETFEEEQRKIKNMSDEEFETYLEELKKKKSDE